MRRLANQAGIMPVEFAHGAERAEEQVRDQFSKQQRVTILLKVERVVEYGLT